MLKRISKKCVVNVYSGFIWLRTRAHKLTRVNDLINPSVS